MGLAGGHGLPTHTESKTRKASPHERRRGIPGPSGGLQTACSRSTQIKPQYLLELKGNSEGILIQGLLALAIWMCGAGLFPAVGAGLGTCSLPTWCQQHSPLTGTSCDNQKCLQGVGVGVKSVESLSDYRWENRGLERLRVQKGSPRWGPYVVRMPPQRLSTHHPGSWPSPWEVGITTSLSDL